MEAHNLPESESDDLQKKLHHAHDKMIRIALFEEESLQEFSEKIIIFARVSTQNGFEKPNSHLFGRRKRHSPRRNGRVIKKYFFTCFKT